MSDTERAALQAAVDQAQAAVDELRPQHDELVAAAAAAGQARAEADAQHKAAVSAANEALRPVDVEMERREGALRAAQAKLEGNAPGEPQGMGE